MTHGETATVVVRASTLSLLRQLAGIEDVTMTELVDRLVRQEIARKGYTVVIPGPTIRFESDHAGADR